MAATATQRSRLRRMCGLAADDATYTDNVLDTYIEEYPLVDSAGYEPDDDDWTATYDLYAAAADICQELAAAEADQVDTTADGAAFALSQQQRNYLTQAQKYRAESKRMLPYFPE